MTEVIETFSLDPEVTAFDLGCLNHETNRMSFRRTWTVPDVRRAFGWLAARNASGSSCYIRPAASILKTSWIMVGPLTTAAHDRLSVVPGMVVESSPGVFEDWVRLTAPVDLNTRVAIARFFVREAGGDPGAVRRAQLGHLPGMTNRTSTCVRDGQAPFSVLRSRSRSAVAQIPRHVERSAEKLRDEGGELTAGNKFAERHDSLSADQSRRDFAIACRLLEAGADDHTIAAAIAAVRGFDPHSEVATSRERYEPRGSTSKAKEHEMFLLTIASWGTAEDRPEREEMRGRMIGRSFMAAYREANGGEKKHRRSWWFEWVRQETAVELRWMWSSERAYKGEHAEVYAQVAGDLIIEGIASAKLVSHEWFRTNISEQYGWLFEPACLEYDGWRLVNLKLRNGEMVKSWTKPDR